MLLAKVPNRVSQTSCQHQQHAKAKAWWAWRRCRFLIFFRCENCFLELVCRFRKQRYTTNRPKRSPSVLHCHGVLALRRVASCQGPPVAFLKQIASTSSMPRPKRGGRGGDVVFLVWELLFGASFLPVQIATSGTTDCRKQHGTWDAKLAAYCLWMLMGIPVHMGTVCHWISQVGVVTTGVGGRGRQPFYNYAMSCNCQCLPLDLEQTQQTMCGTDAGNKTSNCQLKLTWLQCRYCVALQ